MPHSRGQPERPRQLLEGPDADRIIVVDVSPCRPGVPHIPGALPFDLDGSMSDQSTGLPHTMLPADQFQARLRELGVNEDSHVTRTPTSLSPRTSSSSPPPDPGG